MNQPVDYGDMFPKEPKKPSIPDPEAEKEKEWQERWKVFDEDETLRYENEY